MSDYETNVFINCPFDEPFRPLLQALLFTVKFCGFRPRIALESFDSGEVRLHKIKQLLEASKFGIHDLSRIRATKKGEYFRLNMPLELGIDLSCRDYHEAGKYREKKFLILETEKYSVQKGLSNMSFADCKCHGGNREEMVRVIREWFVELSIECVPATSLIWAQYNFFQKTVQAELLLKGFNDKDIETAPVKEYMNWIDQKLPSLK